MESKNKYNTNAMTAGKQQEVASSHFNFLLWHPQPFMGGKLPAEAD